MPRRPNGRLNCTNRLFSGWIFSPYRSNRKKRIRRRLKPRSWPEQEKPMFTGSHIHYEMAEKTQGIGCGGIGAIHLLSQKIGLVDLLNQKVNVLKRHLPYHESDHVLNLAYNILVGGERMGDIELRRQDEGFLNGLGAQRIPDLRIPAVFGHRFRFDPDRIPADVGQRSGSC
ncbi:MAG: hypothetical protein JXQ71_10270, partial [Verrucomicrobia bacterium]|nr:hypothetical protein [Verrucomicrobiota bacterium]